MKLPAALTVMAALSAPAIAQEASPAAPKDQRDKVSYTLGTNVGGMFKQQSDTMKQQGFELNQDMLRRGFEDGLNGTKLQLSQEEMQKTMETWETEMQGKMAEKMKEAGAKNRAAGQAFLAENKKKEGVKTTASGLQYKVVTEGKGPKPKKDDTVVTHYRGTLIDGKEFDSSYKRNEPVSFQVDKVIPGWTEALQLMPVGSKWQLFIPAELGYADRGAGDAIEPGSTLLFDVELLKIGAEEEPKAESKKE